MECYLCQSRFFCFDFFFSILVNLIMKNTTRSWWQLKRLRFHCHVIITPLTPLGECVMNSSEEGLPAEHICCLKPQHNWAYNFFKVTLYFFFKVTSLDTIEVSCKIKYGAICYSDWWFPWLLSRRCNWCTNLVFVAPRTLLKISFFTDPTALLNLNFFTEPAVIVWMNFFAAECNCN